MKSSRGTNLNINRNELLLNMKQVAVLMTVFNRLEKTIQCLNTLFESLQNYPALKVDVFLTDDGSGDHTSSVLKEMYNGYSLYLLQGDGNLTWATGVGLLGNTKTNEETQESYYAFEDNGTWGSYTGRAVILWGPDGEYRGFGGDTRYINIEFHKQ